MSNNQSFSQAYQELQSLTAEFEKGDLDLDKAIPKFKRATELAKTLKSQLAKFESDIEEISLSIDSQKDLTD